MTNGSPIANLAGIHHMINVSRHSEMHPQTQTEHI
jgi:hypothetical protein